MASLFGDHITEANSKAFQRLVELTAELGHLVSFEEAKKKHLEDETFPTPNDFARMPSFSEYGEAAKKAYMVYQRSLPDDGADDEEEIGDTVTEIKSESDPEVEPDIKITAETEVEPESEAEEEVPPYDPETDAPDPFDGDPIAPPAPSDDEEAESDIKDTDEDDPEPPKAQEAILEEGDGEVIKLYTSKNLSSDPLLPRYSLVNYLFQRRVRVVDPRFQGKRTFYAEETGFHASIIEGEDIDTEETYLVESEGEDIPNMFAVEQKKTQTKLMLTGIVGNQVIKMGFPGRSSDTYYIVTEEVAKAARWIGRPTDDLLFVSDGDYIDTGKTNEVIVRKFRRL